MNRKPLTPEQKRTRDIRNGVLLAHVVVSWVVIVLVHFKWWSVFSHGDPKPVAEFWGNDDKAFQTGYITVAALIAFFFTSYDIVTGTDIQWPPLLASAFALGCAAEVTYKLVTERDVIYRNVVAYELGRDADREQETAAVSSSSTAAVDSSGIASVASGARTKASDEGIRLKINYGLYATLYGTFAMVLLSIHLTFFAKREET